MRFTEINPFGVYVAPTSSTIVVAWVAPIGLRWFAARFGLTRYVLLAQRHRRVYRGPRSIAAAASGD